VSFKCSILWRSNQRQDNKFFTSSEGWSCN